MMKSILSSIVFLAGLNLAIAQQASDVAAANTYAPESSLTVSAKKKTVLTKQQQSQAAIYQLSAHLSENLEYPESLSEYGLEGTIIVEVRLSDQGEITQVLISKSLHPKIDAVVQQTMESLHTIKVNNNTYEGVKKIRIPVAYSLF